jgi:hypothetical protein
VLRRRMFDLRNKDYSSAEHRSRPAIQYWRLGDSAQPGLNIGYLLPVLLCRQRAKEIYCARQKECLKSQAEITTG